MLLPLHLQSSFIFSPAERRVSVGAEHETQAKVKLAMGIFNTRLTLSHQRQPGAETDRHWSLHGLPLTLQQSHQRLEALILCPLPISAHKGVEYLKLPTAHTFPTLPSH